jgi:preprotein translocase subunit SecA
MDYLQEGINLRAMGQRDPLAEWQREGFDMFEAMMGQIEDDFVRYVFHLQVVVDEQPEAQLRNVRYSAAEEPVQGANAMRSAATADPEGLPATASAPVATATMGRSTAPAAPASGPTEPVRVDKTPGRNEPCFCGSGKKYKMCHGR